MLPGGDVGASYKKVKCRTPAKAHIAGKIDNVIKANLIVERSVIKIL